MDKVEAVQNMQDYIRMHVLEPEFRMKAVYAAAGYSKRHGDRMFKELIGMTPLEYVKSVRLTASAERLVKTRESVLEIALDSSFRTHEGFTRAFQGRFFVSPGEYRRKQNPIPLFVQYPILHYYALKNYREDEIMSEHVALCMMTPVARPKRKLLYQPAAQAEDYMSYCEEKGCEWEGLLNSISEKYDVAAILELPDFLVKEGRSKVAAGVEVPLSYEEKVPQGYEVAELQECIMLYVQTESYESEERFCEYIGYAYEAVEKYQAEKYGYCHADEIAPRFNFGAEAATGARLAIPIRKKHNI